MLNEILNEEVARELMIEIDPHLSQEKFEQVWEACNGNPWNAQVVYKIMECVKKNE